MAKTMLLMEDNLTIQEIIALAFEDTGYDIITADDAAEGLQQLRTLVPDIIVADAALPDLDGFQLCRMIRGTARLQHVPVLLLTSNFATYDKARGDRAGVSGHLAKPFEPDTLRMMVQQLVAEATYPASPHGGRTMSSHDAQMWPTEPLTSPSPSELEIPVPPAAPRSEENPEMDQAEPPAAPGTTGQVHSPGSDALVLQALGSSLVQMLREALHTHLETTLERLTPQILEAVQEVVKAKVPDLLETLLQQEIDKLKRAVEDDEQHGDQ